MNGVALVLVLVAAVLHASWNIRLKTAADPLLLATRAMALGAIGLTPPAAVAWLLLGRPGLGLKAVAVAAASAVVEVAYFVLLSGAYRRGELSTVYPIARGTAPILAVLVGVGILGERLAPLETAGVAVVVVGLWLVRRPSAQAASGLALLTGVAIATYSSLDAVGVRSGPTWLYAWLLWALTAAALWAVNLLRNRRNSALDRRQAPAPGWGAAAAASALMTGAYVPVLFAFSLAPLAIVAPAREVGIVVAAAWGVFRLGERQGLWQRLAGSAGVLAGIVMLAWH